MPHACTQIFHAFEDAAPVAPVIVLSHSAATVPHEKGVMAWGATLSCLRKRSSSAQCFCVRSSFEGYRSER